MFYLTKNSEDAELKHLKRAIGKRRQITPLNGNPFHTQIPTPSEADSQFLANKQNHFCWLTNPIVND